MSKVDKFIPFSMWILIVFLGPRVFGKGVIEPYAGIEANTFQFEGTGAFAGVSSKGTAHGPILGIRVSWAESLFFFGGEASYQSFQFKYENQTSPTTDGVRAAVFGIIGMDFGSARIWLGAAPTESVLDKGSTSAGGPTYAGSAVKLGFGIYLAQRLSLNLEVTSHALKTYKGPTGGESDMSQLYQKSEYQGAAVTLSVPISM